MIQIPFEVDYAVVFIGGYAGAGFVVFWRRVAFRNLGEKLLYAQSSPLPPPPMERERTLRRGEECNRTH